MAKPTVEEINTAISEWWGRIPDLPLRVNAVKEIVWWFCTDGLHDVIQRRGLSDAFLAALPKPISAERAKELRNVFSKGMWLYCTATAAQRASALYRVIQQNIPPGAGGSTH